VSAAGANEACERCLRRSFLLGLLAPRIAGLLQRPDRRAPALLSLREDELIAAVGGDHEAELASRLECFDARAARRELEGAEVGAACRHGDAFPPALRDLPDCPAVLYHVPRAAERLVAMAAPPTVAVVGARRASHYGRTIAYELGRGLGAAGVTVVSGLALGIDAAAHRGALDAGGRAVAVLAGGPDVPYPRTNRALHWRMREAAVVVSELPPGTRPFRWSFPARNRIMAGLAAMSIVVEAAERSGSLITAEFAEDLGREVGAMPGPVNSRLAEGSNRLLREGAVVVRGAGDVLDELFGAGAWERERIADADPAEALDPRLRLVLDAVEAGEPVESIGREERLSAREVRASLGQLESRGLIARAGVGAYVRTAP
jgi:DNA processing protein